MKFLLLLFFIFSWSEVRAQSSDCEQKIKRGHLTKGDTVERIKVLKDDVELQDVLKCAKREDFLARLSGTKLNAKTKLKKGQVLKIPLRSEIPNERGFSLFVEHNRASIDASVFSRTIEQTANLIELGYQMTLRHKLDLLLFGGVKLTSAKIEEGSSAEKISDLGPAGQAILIYKQSAVLDYRAFYELDRYVVVGDATSSDVNYAVAMKHSLGAGAKMRLKKNWTVGVNLGAVLPSNNTVSSIESGYQAKLELGYIFKRFEIGASYQKQKVKTENYDDDASLLGLKVYWKF